MFDVVKKAIPEHGRERQDDEAGGDDKKDRMKHRRPAPRAEDCEHREAQAETCEKAFHFPSFCASRRAARMRCFGVAWVYATSCPSFMSTGRTSIKKSASASVPRVQPFTIPQ